ncbi:MAG: recombinase family protein, partial [Acidobacteria bacterium]|nr:recombinase family protein [Acidobacteriota bacterium]
CPSKSLPAQDIEESVVERIRALGKHPQVLAETIRRVREEADSRRRELQAEIVAADKELTRLNRELINVAGTGGNGIRVDRIADLQERIGGVERRLSELRNELQALSGGAIQEEELTRSLAAFDPVWKSLNTVEQSRFLKAVIERIGYDGGTGRVAVSFRSPTLKGVCNGVE